MMRTRRMGGGGGGSGSGRSEWEELPSGSEARRAGRRTDREQRVEDAEVGVGKERGFGLRRRSNGGGGRSRSSSGGGRSSARELLLRGAGLGS